MSGGDRVGAGTPRYVPQLHARPFYRATFVLMGLPLVVQAGFFTWLWFHLDNSRIAIHELGIPLAGIVAALVVAHLRIRSALRRAHQRALRAADGPDDASDRTILWLLGMPRRLLALEAFLALAVLVPLPVIARTMDARLLEPLIALPTCILVMMIPSYLQSELWEVRRVVRFLAPPTEPGVLEGHMRGSYLMGGTLVLIPTGIALFEVYELSHILLLTESGTSLNVVRHLGPLPLAAGLAVLGTLMALTWWIGSRTGREVETISRFFEDAFRKPTGRISMSSSMPEPGTFTVTEILRLRETARRFAGSLHDIRTTQMSQIEALEQAQRVKTVFLASMSHDLKSPLNSIIGFSELLLRGIEGDLTEGQKEDIRLIHASGEELLSLINNILDSARLEAGKLELHKEWTPSVELVSSVVKTGMQQIGTKRITFESEIQPGLPPVFVDPHRISQSIGNLISNAIKFMEEGKVSVRAYVHRTTDDPPRKFLRIDVTDTGQGIREEDRDRIFEAFQQIDRSYSRRASGMGLGLTLTRNLVDLHGGKLILSSELGKGSTFSISLPVED